MLDETDFHPHGGRPLSDAWNATVIAIGIGYVIAYVVLDRLSYLSPFGTIGITAWNPQTGLSFALVLALGRRFIPYLLLAPIVSGLMFRKVPPSLPLEFVVALIVGGGYACATSLLTTRGFAIDAALRSRHDLVRLSAVAALAVLLVAFVCVALLVAQGYLDPAQAPRAMLRYWVGDFIGIIVVTPFLLMLATGRNVLPLNIETGIAALLLLASVAIIFGPGDVNRFQLFYLLFVPVIWMAVRFGLEGVTGILLLTQICLVAAIQVSGQTPYNVTNFQTLMLVLAITGLTMGMLVTEARQRQRELWLHREALGRAARVGGMGELAAALAHEINQPLTAIGNYVRLVQLAVEQNPADMTLATDSAGKAARQVERAATVVRRLRDFIGGGRLELETVAIPALMDRTASIYRDELDLHHITYSLHIDGEIPPVSADPLQIEQVVVNILRNSIDAVSDAGRADGAIRGIVRVVDDSVEVSIRDNGPGFDSGLLGRDITPFTTTKANGMGLGLSLSNSIITAHGGALRISGDGSGAVVSFTIPLARPETQHSDDKGGSEP